jgi:hypothetical protein
MMQEEEIMFFIMNLKERRLKKPKEFVAGYKKQCDKMLKIFQNDNNKLIKFVRENMIKTKDAYNAYIEKKASFEMLKDAGVFEACSDILKGA